MKLEQVFEQTHRLPSVPKVVQELIDSLNNPDVIITDIANRIALDQVIAAKTLRLANSAHFSPARRIGSLNEAAMVLGFSTLRTLVVATGITGAFASTPGFDRKSFWLKSLDVASHARWIAKIAKQDSDAAFTCGLIHNIGELLIHVVSPEIAVHIDLSVAKGADRKILEDNNIGFDYLEVGAELARRWNFPDNFRLAILHQTTPLQNKESWPLSLTLNCAVHLCRLLDKKPLASIQAEDLPLAVLEALGIDPQALLEKLPEAQSAAAEMHQQIGV